MNLFNSSRQADEICMVYCKAQANLYLDCENAVLVRVKTDKGTEHIVWMDESLCADGVYTYCRAFYEPQMLADEDVGDIVCRIEIQPDSDIFCYNGNVYYLYSAQNKNQQIRRLMAYFSQSVVEEIERQNCENQIPEAIFISNFYTLDGIGKYYALTCWGISYRGYTNYLPVFKEDQHFIDEYELSHFVREELNVGDVFKNNGYYYKIRQNQLGKLELEQAKSVFLFGREDVPESPVVPVARIVSVNFGAR